MAKEGPKILDFRILFCVIIMVPKVAQAEVEHNITTHNVSEDWCSIKKCKKFPNMNGDMIVQFQTPTSQYRDVNVLAKCNSNTTNICTIPLWKPINTSRNKICKFRNSKTGQKITIEHGKQYTTCEVILNFRKSAGRCYHYPETTVIADLYQGDMAKRTSNQSSIATTPATSSDIAKQTTNQSSIATTRNETTKGENGSSTKNAFCSHLYSIFLFFSINNLIT